MHKQLGSFCDFIIRWPGIFLSAGSWQYCADREWDFRHTWWPWILDIARVEMLNQEIQPCSQNTGYCCVHFVGAVILDLQVHDLPPADAQRTTSNEQQAAAWASAAAQTSSQHKAAAIAAGGLGQHIQRCHRTKSCLVVEAARSAACSGSERAPGATQQSKSSTKFGYRTLLSQKCQSTAKRYSTTVRNVYH